jgi:RNA recognition motif-containing protein
MQLHLLCAPHGSVKSACVIRSKITGLPFGYGFVEMGSGEEARAVITALNGARLQGQRLDVFSAPGLSPG